MDNLLVGVTLNERVRRALVVDPSSPTDTTVMVYLVPGTALLKVACGTDGLRLFPDN